MSCGAFLDYGPYASFAPCFDGAGVEVGQVGVAEVIYERLRRRERRERARALREGMIRRMALEAEKDEMEIDGDVDEVTEVPAPTQKPEEVLVDVSDFSLSDSSDFENVDSVSGTASASGQVASMSTTPLTPERVDSSPSPADTSVKEFAYAPLPVDGSSTEPSGAPSLISAEVTDKSCICNHCNWQFASEADLHRHLPVHDDHGQSQGKAWP